MTCTRKLLGQRNKRNKEENYSVLPCKSKDHERVKVPLTVSKIVAILTARGLAFGTGSVFSNTPPQTFRRPRADAKCLALALGRAFVRVSATISSVGQ